MRRVMIGSWVMATLVGVPGASMIGSLQNRAAALQHSAMDGTTGTAPGSGAEWVIGLITHAGVGFALRAGWAIAGAALPWSRPKRAAVQSSSMTAFRVAA